MKPTRRDVPPFSTKHCQLHGKKSGCALIQYFGYLGRNPDDTPDANFDGYNFWLGKLNNFGGNFQNAETVKAFLVAGEYRGRFPR